VGFSPQKLGREPRVADLEFRNASVLLFDPVGPNMLSTRSMLLQIGFERIEATRDFNALTRKLKDAVFDLALLEVSDAGGDVCSLVRALRRGEVGYNPFMVVILTSWARKRSELAQLIDTGSDDLLLRPFSPNNLQSRIQAFAKKRKPFVVTGSYIGPDRSQDGEPMDGAKIIEAPNSLKAAAEGDHEGQRKQYEAVAAAAEVIDRERLRRLALRISAAAHIRLSGKDDPGSTFDDLLDGASELRRRLVKRGQKQAIEIAVALCAMLTRIKEDGTADNSQLELLRDLPMGVLAAVEGNKAADKAREEIESVLAKVRARFAQDAGSNPVAAAG
jgi:DNA-binding response OmpR family regulator